MFKNCAKLSFGFNTVKKNVQTIKDTCKPWFKNDCKNVRRKFNNAKYQYKYALII